MIFLPQPLRWLAQHPVFQKHPLRTSGRWLYWQIRQRVTRRPLKMGFINGSLLEVHAHEGLTGYWYVTFPDFDEQVFLLRFLQSGDVFFDIGANAGAYSIQAASAGCRVVAMEPVPKPFDRLMANIFLNEASGKIKALPMAVGEVEGRASITTDFGTGNHLTTATQSGNVVNVDVTTLNRLGLTEGMPSFIKIDVEGYEPEVIRGGREVLRSPGLVGLLLETFRSHNWQSPKFREMEAILAEHGFLPFDYEAHHNRLIPLKTESEGGNNTFYIRDLALVKQRLQRSESDPRISKVIPA